MELQKGAENLARDKVEAPKPKRRLLDIGNSTQAESRQVLRLTQKVGKQVGQGN